ncbi:survival motor neuron protein [Drosophila guanche]|uniref:Blast:Survival motor neuron protein n=1 Tax=Drosophila guanche TaxID=7266 RepID=A0A3B0JYJ0_DROGU|nr:survival motor neuron protein [Drosophila guanche]SPP87114.1 blast:Survival motor neuron protein [Drosophila guanche]
MCDDANDAAWDDSLLIKVYDESVNLAREALARRLADSTNTREEENKKEEFNIESATDATSPEPVFFKVGDFARATYTDGVDYEGTVVSINEEAATCVIRYLGYENEQEVLLADLLQSWGKDARRQQSIMAYQYEAEEAQQEKVRGKPASASKKSSDKAKPAASAGLSGGPGMPTMPLIPPIIPPCGNPGEEQDLMSMLTAWYMSGYYTGYFQGKKAIPRQVEKKKTPKK